MAPSIAARRVDGVQGARCPKGSAEMAALSVPRARTCESNLPPDVEYGRDGRTRCAAEMRSATYILAQAMWIIRCFKRKRAHSGRPGQPVGAPSVGATRVPRPSCSICRDAVAPEPQLATHTKRAKQPKESKAVAGAIDSPCDGQVVLAGERRKN